MGVAVLGAGVMGAQIGCEYALGDHDVVLHSRNVEVARARAEAGLSFLREQGLRSADEVRAASARLETGVTAKEAANGAALIVESLPESLELKVSIVRAALAETPDAVVVTNTSSLSISALGEAMGVPEKTVGTHYLNPPLLMPPVEIVTGERTAPETVELVRRTVASLGKLPISVGRDVTGFIWKPPAVHPRAGMRMVGRERRRLPRGRRCGDARRIGAPLASGRSIARDCARRRRDVEPGWAEHRAGAVQRARAAGSGLDCDRRRRPEPGRGRARRRARQRAQKRGGVPD